MLLPGNQIALARQVPWQGKGMCKVSEMPWQCKESALAKQGKCLVK
jgi:hypothetical protein